MIVLLDQSLAVSPTLCYMVAVPPVADSSQPAKVTSNRYGSVVKVNGRIAAMMTRGALTSVENNGKTLSASAHALWQGGLDG